MHCSCHWSRSTRCRRSPRDRSAARRPLTTGDDVAFRDPDLPDETDEELELVLVETDVAEQIGVQLLDA